MAEERLIREHRLAVAEAGQRLFQQLETTRNGDSLVLYVGVTNDAPQLYWQSNRLRPRPELRALLVDADRALYEGQRAIATELLRRALALARNDGERSLVQLSRAQVDPDVYWQLIQYPLDVVDDEGMPVAIYAAQKLGREIGGIGDLRMLSPAALYALRSYVSANDSLKVEKQIRIAEQLLSLSANYRALRSAAAQHGGGIWQLHGDIPWFVRASERTVVVIDAQPFLKRLRVHRAPREGAEPLGPGFPGLYASIPGFTTSLPALSRTLLAALALLAILIASGTAFLTWRDVRRDAAVAEQRSHFVSSVSHELKTPLTAVRMYAELLRMRHDISEAERQEYLDTIISESERLTRLINNVLDISKIERGERNYHLRQVSLHDLVADIQRSMAFPLSQAGFTLRVECGTDVDVVKADYDALAQAILNLISNAVKFSGEQREIDLIVTKRGGNAIIQVRDRGRGMTASVRQRVFDRFYRAPDAEQAGIPGNGLGLAVVAHVAAGHGGSVDVESEPGTGSTFSLYLPLES